MAALPADGTCTAAVVPPSSLRSPAPIGGDGDSTNNDRRWVTQISQDFNPDPRSVDGDIVLVWRPQWFSRPAFHQGDVRSSSELA